MDLTHKLTVFVAGLEAWHGDLKRRPEPADAWSRGFLEGRLDALDSIVSDLQDMLGRPEPQPVATRDLIVAVWPCIECTSPTPLGSPCRTCNADQPPM